MVERLDKGGTSSYSYVLRQYNRVESGKRLDVFGRYEVHRGLVKALRARVDKDLLSVVRGLIKKKQSSVFPSQVVGLKAFAGSARGDVERADIVKLYSDYTRSKERGLQTWAVRLLVDSGIVCPVPVSAARKEFEPDLLIAVDILNRIESEEEFPYGLDVLLRSETIACSRLNAQEISKADIVIRPEVGQIYWSDFSELDSLVKEGVTAAEAQLEEIRRVVRRKRRRFNFQKLDPRSIFKAADQ